MNYKLIIFDVDGTLVPFVHRTTLWVESDILLPGVLEWFERWASRYTIAIATNQGGVGLRHWMETDGFGEPEKYPTEEAVRARLERIVKQLPGRIDVNICFAYQSKKTGLWSPTPKGAVRLEWEPNSRKPAPGMLLRAMETAGVSPQETLMVGDDIDDDVRAAMKAKCEFMFAQEFFHHE